MITGLNLQTTAYLKTRKKICKVRINIPHLILIHEKFLQFDWLRAVVFQLNLKIPTYENNKPCAGSSINK